MKRIDASKFKAQWPGILNRVDPEGIVITKNGRPVARMLPIPSQSGMLIGAMKGRIKIKGENHSTGLKWDACGGKKEGHNAVWQKIDMLVTETEDESHAETRSTRRRRFSLDFLRASALSA